MPWLIRTFTPPRVEALFHGYRISCSASASSKQPPEKESSFIFLNSSLLNVSQHWKTVSAGGEYTSPLSMLHFGAMPLATAR